MWKLIIGSVAYYWKRCIIGSVVWCDGCKEIGGGRKREVLGSGGTHVNPCDSSHTLQLPPKQQRSSPAPKDTKPAADVWLGQEGFDEMVWL